MGKDWGDGGIAGGGGCFLKPSKSLLCGWTFPHSKSGPQVAGKQSRAEQEQSEACQHSQTTHRLSAAPQHTGDFHPPPIPASQGLPLPSAREHRWYRRESCAHSTKGSSSLDVREAGAAHGLSCTSIPMVESFSTSSAAQLTLEMPT